VSVARQPHKVSVARRRAALKQAETAPNRHHARA